VSHPADTKALRISAIFEACLALAFLPCRMGQAPQSAAELFHSCWCNFQGADQAVFRLLRPISHTPPKNEAGAFGALVSTVSKAVNKHG
jgi:hypothetical protein